MAKKHVKPAAELFFSYDAATNRALDAVIRELNQAAKKQESLKKLITRTNFTGDLRRDRPIVARLLDLDLQGLAIDDKVHTARLKGNDIQRQALAKQVKQDGEKKKPGWRDEFKAIHAKLDQV